VCAVLATGVGLIETERVFGGATTAGPNRSPKISCRLTPPGEMVTLRAEITAVAVRRSPEPASVDEAVERIKPLIIGSTIAEISDARKGPNRKPTAAPMPEMVMGVSVTRKMRAGFAGSADGARVTVVAAVIVIVLTEKKNTRAVSAPVNVMVIDPAPKVAIAGPRATTSGMNVPPVSTPLTMRIPVGTAVAGTKSPAALAAIVPLEIGTVGTVIAVAAAGEAGRAPTVPDRRKSPPVPTSVTNMAEVPAGGTAAELKIKLRAVEVAVSSGVPVLPLAGGGENMLPASDGKAVV